MGDIKRFKKKFATPMHPWNATRIKLEKDIMRKYGVANKREIWRMESVLKGFKDQTKRLLTRTDEQANRERSQIHQRIVRLGLIKATGGDDDILGLQLKDIMDRRLQTLVLKNRMARSVKHARQLITHEHIVVDGRKITSPSYLVGAAEEATLRYAPDSPFMREDHPEAFSEELARKRIAGRRKDRRRDEDSIVAFDVKELEDPDEVPEEAADASVEDLAAAEDPEEAVLKEK